VTDREMITHHSSRITSSHFHCFRNFSALCIILCFETNMRALLNGWRSEIIASHQRASKD